MNNYIQSTVLAVVLLLCYTNQHLSAMDYASPISEKLICILSAAHADMDYISKGNQVYRPSLTEQTSLAGLTADLKAILAHKITEFNKNYNAAAFTQNKMLDFQTEYLMITSYLEELVKQDHSRALLAQKKTIPVARAHIMQKKSAPVPAKKQSAAPAPHKAAARPAQRVVTRQVVRKTPTNIPVAQIAAKAVVQKNYTHGNYTINEWSEKVNKQTGATCGFHTVKNGKLMLEYLTGKIDKQTLEKQLKAAPNTTHNFPLAQWQNYIGRTDNLAEDELYRLAAHIGLPAYNFTAIQTIRNFDPAHLWMTNQQFNRLCSVIAQTQAKQPLVHVFALGTMSEFTQKTTGLHRGADGHWICIVLHIDEHKKITLYVFDSGKNSTATTHALAQELIKLLALDPDALKMARLL